MSWKKVGSWLSSNGKGLLGIAGSIASGNIPGAVASVTSMVQQATGENTPEAALASLQGNPEAMVRLEKIARFNEADIRAHARKMHEMELEDSQRQHKETQDTIRAGDKAEDPFVRRTRPAQSWLSLMAAIAYVFITDSPDVLILGALLTLPFAYAGLRQIGKGIDSVQAVKAKIVSQG